MRLAQAAATTGAAAALVVSMATSAAAVEPVRFAAALDDGARLGSSTALQIALKLDTRQRPAPLRAVQVLYDQTLGVTTSGLGLAACRRPRAAFADVVASGEMTGRGGCPRNSLMATGTARGEIRLNGPGMEPIGEVANVNVYAGPLTNGRLQLEAQVDGQNPIGARLLYAGQLHPPHGPWGGGLGITLPPLPDSWGAEITLTEIELSVGGSAIRYSDPHSGSLYQPAGVGLPSRCPRAGFRMQARLQFADGVRDRVSFAIPCPRSR